MIPCFLTNYSFDVDTGLELTLANQEFQPSPAMC